MFAPVEVWRRGKLSGMRVGVTIRAVPKLHRIYRGFALRNMALRALQRRMLAFERVGGGRVLFDSEGGGFKPVRGVAVRTLTSACELGELSSMWIWLVAIRALLKCQRFLEVPSCVTPYALHIGMFPKQRKLRLGMIKRAIHLRRYRPVPACGGVTGLARLRKTSAMRISMTIAAAAKPNSGVAQLFIGPRSVTLLAGNLDVQTGQGITRDRMIERTNIDFFPLGEVVALQAVGAEPTAVLVLMAVGALGGNPQKCFPQILDLDAQAFFFGDVLRRVAAAAAQP
jgi:hypothetical protein